MLRAGFLVLGCLSAVLTVQTFRSWSKKDAERETAVARGPVANGTGDQLIDAINADRRAEDGLESALLDARDDAGRVAAYESFRLGNSTASRLLAAVIAAGPHPLVADALARLVARHPGTPEGARALEIMLRDHARSSGIGRICTALAESDSKGSEDALRAIVAENPNRYDATRARYALATWLKRSAEGARWRDASRARSMAEEAEAALEGVLADGSGIHEGRGLLVDRALADLDELRALGPGKLAPEIDGMTVDGARMRLSDYRGRVVALAFWGDWCSLCRAMLGHERALVERFRGRPFALVGVNSDNRRDIASSLEAKGTVTWRSWVDGGEVRGGAIARRWNVTALPTFFVIDAKGVIRLKVGPRPDDHDALYILDEHTNLRNRWELRAEAVSEEVEALVKEAEARD